MGNRANLEICVLTILAFVQECYFDISLAPGQLRLASSLIPDPMNPGTSPTQDDLGRKFP